MSSVLIVTGYWPTKSNRISGIFVAQQAKAICDRGVSVTIIATKYALKRDCHLWPSELGLPENVKFYSCRLFRLPEVLSDNRIALSVNSFLAGRSILSSVGQAFPGGGAPDGCIAHGIRYSGISAVKWARKFNARTLVFIHGVDPFLSKRRVIKWISREAIAVNRFIHRFVLVGSPLLRTIASIGLDIRKAIFIPNGTMIPELSQLRKSVNENTFPVIISVSNLIALKGVDDNIRAIHILKTAHGIDCLRYDIIGDGPERMALEQLVGSLGLQGQVRFLGRLSYQDTMDAISRADIFSLPSWGEAFGIVYLEAMARFKPTVGCLDNGAADIITDGQDGMLVPPKNPEALANALKILVRDSGIRAELGRRGRATAENFTWDVNASRVLQALGLG